MSGDTRLAWTLRASALFDWLALALLLWMPEGLLAFFDHPLPAEPFLFRLAALPLWMAPFVYWMASTRLGTPLVEASVVLRLSGAFGIAVLLLAHRPAGAAAYWSFVLADTAWAGLILVLRRRP